MSFVFSPFRSSTCGLAPSSIKIRVKLSVLVQVANNRSPIRSMSMNQAAGSDALPSQNDGAEAEKREDVVVQYVVLRRDLIDTWPLGSVVTQGCHASVAAIWPHKDDPHTAEYCSSQNIDSMHKVTLEVKGEAQIVNLSEKLTASALLINYGLKSLKTFLHAWLRSLIPSPLFPCFSKN